MNAKSQHTNKRWLLAFLLVTASRFLIGCNYFPESTFVLADESRLPKWISIPPGETRAGTTLAMSYYIEPWGSNAVFTLRRGNKQILEKVSAKVACEIPFRLASSPRQTDSNYPMFEAVSVDGGTEILEHKKMQPIFYVTDDAAVWKQYRATGCS
jgi:hypothetical protein